MVKKVTKKTAAKKAKPTKVEVEKTVSLKAFKELCLDVEMLNEKQEVMHVYIQELYPKLSLLLRELIEGLNKTKDEPHISKLEF